MKLILVRHAIAEEANAFIAAGGTDAQRPLTEIGRKKMRKGANRLRVLVGRIDLLAHSPLLRACETADIIARACGEPPQVECADLDHRYPPAAVIDWLAQYPPAHQIIVVGHEPQLGLLAGLLLAGAPHASIIFRKGGVAMIECPQHAEAGQGILHWALTPGQLRSLKQD